MALPALLAPILGIAGQLIGGQGAAAQARAEADAARAAVEIARYEARAAEARVRGQQTAVLIGGGVVIAVVGVWLLTR